MLEVGQMREWIDDASQIIIKEITEEQVRAEWEDGTEHWYSIKTIEFQTDLVK